MSQLDQLNLKARRIADEVGVLIDSPVYFDDPRVGDIEHVCHELAHAALLGLPFRDPYRDNNLSVRVGERLMKLSLPLQRLNEATCFVVERRVLAALDLEWGEDHFETHSSVGVTLDSQPRRTIRLSLPLQMPPLTSEVSESCRGATTDTDISPSNSS